MFSDGHLSFYEVALPPGDEWRFARAGCGFVRVCEGVGYWLANELTQELGAGDVVVCTAGGGLFRASQIGAARLQIFVVDPAHLDELLTPGEIQHLDTVFKKTQVPLRIATRADPLAADYQQLAFLPEKGARALIRRGQMLRMTAACFAEFLPSESLAFTPGLAARERFLEVVGRLAAAEIAAKSALDLAELCGCSSRHFHRLFQEEFGESFRAWTTKQRLQKARHLLAATNESIAEVAEDSGFPRRNEFIARFKDQFGVTPGEWRRQGLKAAKRAGTSADPRSL